VLAQRLSTSEVSLRKLVSRTRRKIARVFLDQQGWIVEDNDVIENRSGKGYLLNGRVTLVQPWAAVRT